MFFFIVIVAVVLCAVILYLPYAAGLTTVEKQSRKKTQQKTKRSSADDQYSGYVPPDEELRLQEEAGSKGKTSALKDKIKITSDSMPIQIKLNQDGGLRKRTERSVGDFNPNNYDYDLDELIREETEGEAQRKTKEYYSNEHVGGDKETMV
ncbi:hypothetical protein JCM33374_g2818 [Metschnikowia sp. JCM 33374]|nr:hypothetical protein JCM33374_g2818 [Metschnikowia sp. JCM 33374]